MSIREKIWLGVMILIEAVTFPIWMVLILLGKGEDEE